LHLLYVEPEQRAAPEAKGKTASSPEPQNETKDESEI
jgi:hypothetical protein